jgi:signal transduction histidine kinase
MASAGLQVEVVTSGHPRTLTPAIDHSAYRVLQEGLTNVLVHSGAHEAFVHIVFADGRLQLDVRDKGDGTSAPFGSGLIGMQERVTLLGGDLEAGPFGAGWRLRVELPLSSEGDT